MPVEDNPPVLGMNTSGVNDYGSNAPFLDLFKMSRPFMAQRDWSPDDPDHWDPGIDVIADGDLWPTTIPEGADYVGAIVMDQDAGEFAPGRYVIRYEGEGDIQISGATLVSQEEGRIIVELADAERGWMHLQIHETDPSGTGNYIRDIEVFREEFEPLADAGVTFDPDYTSKMDDFRALRFMTWSNTNDAENEQMDWEDRPTMNEATYATAKGVPLEAQIQLANEMKVDPWFTAAL